MSTRLARIAFALLLALTSILPPTAFARSAQSGSGVSRLPVSAPRAVNAAGPRGGRSVLLPIFIVNGERAETILARAIPVAPLVSRLNAEPVTEVRICNTDAGCTGLVTDTLAADTPLTLYAAGYGGGPLVFQNNEPVTWTVSSGATVAPQTGVSTTLDGVTPGTVVVTATVIATPTIEAIATFTVTLGALNRVTIRSAANGGGSDYGPATLVAGDGQTLFAAGYDSDDNFIADQIVTWSLAGGIGSIAPTSGISTSFTAITASVGSITAQAAPSITDTASITVIPGSAAALSIAPRGASVTAGQMITYTAVATDAFGNALGTVTTQTTFSIAGASGGIFAGNAVTPTIAATWTVTGALGSAVTTTTLGVIPGAAFTITLAPPTAVISAGTALSYTAAATDVYGNSLGDVTAATTFSIGPGSGGSFVGRVITPAIAGAYVVTGTHSSSAYGNASLSVTHGTPSALNLAPATAVISAGVPVSYTATAFDAFNNLVGNVTAGTVFTTTPHANAAFVANTIAPTLAGAFVVSGTHAVLGLSGSATLSVTPNLPFTLTVLPATDIISAGTPLSYTATAIDVYGNSNGDQTANTTFVIGPGSGGAFSGSVITPTIVGTYTVTGTHISSIRDTATLQVVPGTPASLTLTPATSVISAGVSLEYGAAAYDAYGNLVGDVTPGTAFSVAPNPRGSFAGSTITPTLAGSYIVTGMHGGFGLLDTAALNVTPNVPFTLTLSPATQVISAGVRITYTAVATDVFGNFIGNVTSATAFSIAPAAGGAFSGSSITPTIKGGYTVTGTHGGSGARGTAALTVTPAAFHHLSIENAPNGTGTPIGPTTITLYDMLTLYAVDYDVYNNAIGANASTWSASGVLSGRLSPTSGFSTTLTPAPVISGTGIVTAVAGLFSDTAGPITVTAPALRISKSSFPITGTPNSLVRYTIVYTNVGGAAAQNVFITETYPLSATYQSASLDPVDGTNNVWSIGSVAPNVSGTLLVWVLPSAEFPVGSVLTNVVRIGASKVNPAVFTQTTPVSSTPNVKVIVSDNFDPVRPDDQFQYTIQYRNDGTAPVGSVRITETYPAGVTYVTASPLPNVGNNVWTLSSLGAGQVGFIFVTVRVKSPIADGTILDDVVTISSSLTNPSIDVELTTVTAPTLGLSKSASDNTPDANSLLTYTLAYTNSGSSYASSVIVTDAVPVNTTYLGCAPSGSCSQSGGVITWTLGQVPSQTNGLLTMTVNVNNNLVNGTILTNTARITATENISAFTRITETVVSLPIVSLTKSDGAASAAAAQTLTYSLAYSNTGNSPAFSVVITDRIPLTTTFQSCAPSCVSMGGGVYSFTLSTVNASTTGRVTVTVQVSPTLPAGMRWITNTARIQTTTSGDNPSDNFAQDVDTVSTVPAFALSAVYSSTAPYPTRIVTYSVRYTNTSAMDTTGVVINATRSPHVLYLSTGSSAWSPASSETYTMYLGNLNARVSGVVTFVTELPDPFTPVMDSFDNIFSISDDGPGGLPPASATITPTLGVPDLVIDSVIVSPSQVLALQPFTVTVVIRNEGLGKACDYNPVTGGCGNVYLDYFIDPATPPTTYSYSPGWTGYRSMPPIDPGLTRTVTIANLMFQPDNDFILYFKVDNWDCSSPGACDPDTGAQHGLVSESDETNNVVMVTVPDAGQYRICLPIVLKKP